MSRAEQLVGQLREELARLDEIELPDITAKDFDSEETKRAVRQGQIAELDAANTYDQIAQSTHNPKVKELFKDVANEELVHQGEFEKAIDTISPKEKQDIEKGEKEAGATMTEAKLRELDEALAYLEENLEEGFIGNTLYRAGQGVANLVRGGRNMAQNFGADIRGVPNEMIDGLLAKLGYNGKAGPQSPSAVRMINALTTAIKSGQVKDGRAIQAYRAIVGKYTIPGKGLKELARWAPEDLATLTDIYKRLVNTASYNPRAAYKPRTAPGIEAQRAGA